MPKLLILAANPTNTNRLRLEEELRDIDDGLRRAQHRDQFTLAQRLAVRPRDIQRAMLEETPQIVHFSGHGEGPAGLVFEDDTGQAQLVSGAALADLFVLFADPTEFPDPIQCIVLNGCYSQVQAEAIAQHVPYVIGISQAIGDRAAIEFAIGFYDALGAGRSVESAFKHGCAAISLDGRPESATPVLLHKKAPLATPNPELTPLLWPAPPDQPLSLKGRLGTHSLPAAKPPTNRPDRNEKNLINAVWTEVADRLQQSLHNAILIRLDMTEQRNQVSRPWDADLRTANQAPQPLAPGTPIANVFDRDDVGGKLLVLGNPGAGKTTTMLDLAATLIQRANADPEAPIPVMVNLSSWQNPWQSCTDWLLQELKSKYGVSPKLGQTWLTQKKLLPLLDGLDELPPARQEPVVKALNTWLASEDGPPRLLVCSRLEEYELYTSNLALNGAICLNPLTDEQLQAYLTSLEMGHLWPTLHQDADLLALVRTPLLLSVSILANEALEPDRWSQLQTTQARLDYLLDTYLVRQLHAPIANKAYPRKKQPTAQQTRHWLTWMARQLQAQSEDEFLIEKMQPTMLANRRQKLIYGLIYGLIFGLIYVLIGVLFHVLIYGLFHGLIYGLIGGLIFGLIFGLIDGLFYEQKTDISSRVNPNQGIRAFFKNTVVLLMVALLLLIPLRIGLLYLLGNFLDAQLIDLIVATASAAVAYSAIFDSSKACARHFSLRLVLHHTNAIPWNYARFFNYCTERRLLQRVGGRYRFIHHLIQERFATMSSPRVTHQTNPLFLKPRAVLLMSW